MNYLPVSSGTPGCPKGVSARQLDIAFSPCPNDTFIFHALLHRLIDTSPLNFVPHISDVEKLNEAAFSMQHTVTKLSFCAYLLLKEQYALLDAGAALGFGCGPILVARSKPESLDSATIAIPGAHTTAYLLLRLWRPRISRVEITRFDAILPGIASGRYDAGVIIHEGRFVYPRYGCMKIVDLGEWWESETGLPTPLGCIAIRKDALPHKDAVESMLRASISFAMAHPDMSRDFVRMHAQELDETVINEHIKLYVNDFTLSLGETGLRAMQTLDEMARCHKVL